jgi:hypothetical protein
MFRTKVIGFSTPPPPVVIGGVKQLTYFVRIKYVYDF